MFVLLFVAFLNRALALAIPCGLGVGESLAAQARATGRNFCQRFAKNRWIIILEIGKTRGSIESGWDVCVDLLAAARLAVANGTIDR